MLDVLQVVYELAACPWRDTMVPAHASSSDGQICPNPFLNQQVQPY